MNSFMNPLRPPPIGSPDYGNNDQQRLSTDQILQLMNQIVNAVKANDYTATVAAKIFTLCQQLKNQGPHLEQNHKSELNRCFVALRQACCRDNGQLGTPCRLKMMEIVELRAMGWRPNLAHTQYYLNRPEQPPPQSMPSQTPPFKPEPMQATSIYQPGNNPVFPGQDAATAAALQQSQQTPLFMAPPPTSAAGMPPGYFFIPAPAPPGPPGWQQHPGLLGAAPNPLEAQWTRNAAAAAAAAAALMGGAKTNAALGLKTPRLMVGNNLGFPIPGAGAGVLNPKSNKAVQLREEVTIRNCDSGKIMGVKGRRVAVVEELSKTVISFQKVDPKSKDRVLTITGSNDESILYAKRLVEETIRRNVSPNRFNDESSQPTPTKTQSPVGTPTATAAPVAEVEEEEEDDDGPGISIETGKDGTLKLCCDDPDVLQAAQVALTEYLNRARRSTRMTAEERAERKERRKSMPLQSTQEKEPLPPPKSIEESKLKSFVGSTPNLAAALAEGLSLADRRRQPPKVPEPTADVTQYTREELLKIRETSVAHELSPELLNNLEHDVFVDIQKPQPTAVSAHDTPTA